MIIAVYVDDLLIVGGAAMVSDTIAGLEQQFCMKDLGEEHYLLGRSSVTATAL